MATLLPYLRSATSNEPFATTRGGAGVAEAQPGELSHVVCVFYWYPIKGDACHVLQCAAVGRSPHKDQSVGGVRRWVCNEA